MNVSASKEDTTQVNLLRFVYSAFPLAESVGLGAEEDFFLNGVVDSMDMFVLIDFVETQFGVKVKDEDLVRDNFSSVGALARFVESRR